MFPMAPFLMHECLERAADGFGDRVAIRSGDGSWTFGDLEGLSNAFADHLAGLGVAAGHRVALMMANRVEFVIAVNGIAKLGAAAVLLSPAWKAAEVHHSIGLTTPVHAVGDADSATLLSETLTVGRVTNLDDASVDPMAGSRDRLDRAVALADEAVLVFSSGTTGLPKAVRHTHASMGHATTDWVNVLGLGPDDRFQVATPPSHILGLLNLLTAMAAGASVRLHRRFDLDEVLRRIESERMTLEMAVAPIALALANHPRLEEYDLSSLRYIMWGATPVTESVAQIVTERTGVRWLPAYGASEVPVISANPIERPEAWRLDSAGLPPAGISLRIADLDTGAILPSGEIGEIQVLSPSVMAGYLPERSTAEVMVDGWYRTGDVGWLEPEGWVHLTDRSKEMIKVNGFQVAPAELEAVLHGHPAVRDCAVFGVPDERAGELPVAAVQLDLTVPLADGALEDLVAESLARYKRLHDVVVVSTIPRLPSGKVLRRVLRGEWMAAHADSGQQA
jgi:acyl-CoA synthetase (AMP-forming)/AMP-acid ligase II